jgi:hypothetical protein
MAACSPKPPPPRPKLDADRRWEQDPAGNLLYENDDGQVFTYAGGSYYPWYTRATGYTTIPRTDRSTEIYSNESGGSSGSRFSSGGSSSSGSWGTTTSTSSRGGFGSSGSRFSGS